MIRVHPINDNVLADIKIVPLTHADVINSSQHVCIYKGVD